MGNGRIVAPRSRREVEELAANTRRDLNLSAEGRVSMLSILDDALYDIFDGYQFRIEDDRAMGKMDGLTDDQKPIIYLKNSVNRALEKGDGRARFTAAHEFGHLLMHCGMPSYRAFSDDYEPLYDPERQANIFAAAFLMPEAAFRRCRTAKEAMKNFGVSRDAALCRARNLRHRFASDRPVLSIKKKGTSKCRSPR